MDRKDLMKKIKMGTGLTHPATFHADDVLSTCLLKMIDPKFKVVRSNVIPNDFHGLVYDVGLGEYDHHQSDAKVRETGIKYASFGLLWRDLSYIFMRRENASVFDDAFVSEIDRCDNGSDTNLLSSSISLFNPTWNSDEESDSQFEKAVNIFSPALSSVIHHFKYSTYVYRYCSDIEECICLALKRILTDIRRDINISPFLTATDIYESNAHLLTPNEPATFFERTFLNQVSRTYGKYKTSPFVIVMSCMRREDRINLLYEVIKRRFFCINALYPARKKCEETYASSKRKDLIVMDKYMPYDAMTEQHESIKAVVFPSDRSGYTISCANMNAQEKLKNKLPIKKIAKRMEFPTELRGMDESYLRNYCKGLFFVHPSGHMASCDTLDDIYEFYKKVS